MNRYEREVCQSTFESRLHWPEATQGHVLACTEPAGHDGRHRQYKGGGHSLAEWWPDERAVKNRCTSRSPERYPVTLEAEPQHIRCAREAGHDGMHSMIVRRPYGRGGQVDWDDPAD